MTMECRDVRPLIDAFVSEQLMVETTQTIVAHVERCPACRAEIDGVRRLRLATRRAFATAASLAPDPEFLAALGARVRAEAAGAAPARKLRHRWLAIAAGLLLVVGGGLGSRQWSVAGFRALLHAAAGDHQFCALTYKLAEKPITLDEAALRYDLVNRALRTVEPSSSVLSGGSLQIVERHSCVYNGQRFSHLVLRYKGEAVSILVANEAGPLDAFWAVGPDAHGDVTAVSATDSFHMASFRSAHHLVFVVSALDQHDIEDVTQAMLAPMTRALAGIS